MEDLELVEYYCIFVVAINFGDCELQGRIQYKILMSYVIRIPTNTHF